MCVVLVATRNPLNIGAAARAMSNFGFRRLRLVNPYEAAFQGARSAVGALTILRHAVVCGSVADAVADCSLVVGTMAAGNRPQPQHLSYPLPAGVLLLGQHLAAGGPAALLFGSEKRGLSNEELSHCDFLLHIPTEGEQPSMNLGQAVAVLLYELAREAEAPPASRKHAANAGELERMGALLLEVFERSGYLPAHASASSLREERERVRRLLHRLTLETADAHALTGMLRQIPWKLRTHNEDV